MAKFYSYDKALTKREYLWTKINQVSVNIILSINSFEISKHNNGVLLLSLRLAKTAAQLEVCLLFRENAAAIYFVVIF